MPGPTPVTTQDVTTVKKHILTQAQYNAKAAAGEINSFEEYYITDANPSTVYVSGVHDGTNWTSLTIGTETHGFAGGGGDVDLLVETTYSALKTLKSGSNLVPGTLYRITDYATTSSTTNTSSANHQFDLVVLATSNNKLDCRAMAIPHAGTTYFNNADLSKWQIWYDINNDTTKYNWADTSSGKGVIYRMIDEWGNDCPYDFKNIQFAVGAKTGPGTVAGVYYYTFSIVSGTGDSTVTDYSLTGRFCHDNVIRPCGDEDTQIPAVLNKIVFRNSGSMVSCMYNHFEPNCYNNVFGSGAIGNKFSPGCSGNTFADDCGENRFDSSCCDNTIGYGGGRNSFGWNCCLNTLGRSCSNISIRHQSNSNNIGDNNINVMIGVQSSMNQTSASCTDIKIGDSSMRNRLGNASSQYGQFCRSIELGDRCQYVYVYNNSTASYNNQLQNIVIASDVVGFSYAPVEINTVARNQGYQTRVAKNSNGILKIYNEADLIQ